MQRHESTLRSLRSTRDLRAEIIALAAGIAEADAGTGLLIVIDPVISETTVRKEWDRLLPAIAPKLRTRMDIEIVRSARPAERVGSGFVPLERPNYRFEVLRLLLGADLEDDGPQPFKGLLEKIGASQTPIREALTELRQASGIVYGEGGGVQARVEDVSMELLAKVGALPQMLRFRFERGARLKPPAELLKRAEPLLGTRGPESWRPVALSGTPVASLDVPGLDLIGMPRLDLVIQVPRDEKHFDAGLMRLLDDGLELEPNVLAPAPVVVTLVRADRLFSRTLDGVNCASRMDVFLSLLDTGLRGQALQYAREVRP